ncbi:MAG: VanW family protein [Muribaculaceae bacterium]|nr:VanW family protein [Muribaculaceae bacterium]
MSSQLIARAKVAVRVALVKLRDAMSGTRFARRAGTGKPMEHYIEVEQPFTASATLDQKKHNLRLAAARIAAVDIAPGEVFSFWRAVGNPNGTDFECSRSIVGGVLQLERGGGLCQASGIIYHLALLAGLDVVERHNHSVDLYTEETRFCPLGSDATVSYGYLDLRLRNNTDAMLRFELIVEDERFVGRLYSDSPIRCRKVTFEREDLDDGTRVARAIDAATGTVLSHSRYKISVK